MTAAGNIMPLDLDDVETELGLIQERLTGHKRDQPPRDDFPF